jgi:hypothetical protein
MFVEQWQTWVLMSLVVFAVLVIPIVLVYIIGIVVVLAAAEASRGGGPEGAFAVLLFYLIIFAGVIVVSLIQAYFSCGLYRAAFKQLQGGRIEVRDLFSGGDCFLRGLGATILVGIAVSIGAVLCIIPGFIAAGMFFFTMPLIVHRGLGVTDAMRASWNVGTQNMLMFTLFAFVVSLIAQAGAYACYVGLLATYPLHFTMGVIAYRDCFGVAGARSYASPATQAAAYGVPPPPAQQPSQPQQWNYPRCQVCGAVLPAAGGFCSGCGSQIPG